MSENNLNSVNIKVKRGLLSRAFSIFRRVLIGKPLSSHDMGHTLLPKFLALPVFASDAISSVAYATQQILLALGGAGLWISGQEHLYAYNTILVASIIVLLLSIVVLSYWQTVYAYPNGGGSYIVSKDNLGITAGLIAAAALLIDYILTVSVSIAAGVQNLSAIPFIQAMHLNEHMVAWCLGSIAVLTFANLRGLKESASVFALFTYGFIFFAYLMILIGIFGPFFGWSFDMSGIEAAYNSNPQSIAVAQKTLSNFGLVVLLHAFANGCSAMTGVEAVSDGIQAFKGDRSRNAAMTLVIMGTILGTLFIGISYIAIKLHVVYWENHGVSSPAVIDQISGAIFGKSGRFSLLYLATQFFTSTILLLAANTSYADFPRLASFLARDGFLPKQLASLGDKLVFHNGILLLGVFSSILIIAKHGNVDALIPLYAVGVFLAFTLSQTGMVRHWLTEKGPNWKRKAFINGFGAVATAIVLIDIAVEKFEEGAWIVIILLVILVTVFRAIRNHYAEVARLLRLPYNVKLSPPKDNRIIVFVSGIHKGIIPALEYARSLSKSCVAVFIEIDPLETENIMRRWAEWAPDIELIVLHSPYRSITRPINDFLDRYTEEHQNSTITVIIPEFVPAEGWHAILHGQTGLRLKFSLLSRRDVIVSNVRYYLDQAGG